MTQPARRRQKARAGTSRFRVGWMRAKSLQVNLYHYPLLEMNEERRANTDPDLVDDESDQEGWVPTEDDAAVYLNLMGIRGQNINLNLTQFTWEELIALEAMLGLAFRIAGPAVRARDRRAKDDARKGEFGNSRYYRSLPEFVIRARMRGGYGQGVRLGPADVLAGNVTPEYAAERVASSREPVAQPEPDETGGEDSGETPVELEGVLQLGGKEEATPPGIPPADGGTASATSTAGWDE